MVQALRRGWSTIRGLLSVALLVFALGQVDWPALQHAWQGIQPGWLLLAWLLLLLANVLGGLRWSWLLHGAEIRGRRLEHVGLYFSGGLINQGLPTIIGGDAYRTLMVSDAGLRRPAVLALVLDRLLGLAGNTLMGAIGLLGAGYWLGGWAPWLGGGLLLAMLVFLIATDLLLRLRVAHPWLDRVSMRFGLPVARSLLEKTFLLPAGLVQAALALLIHLLTILALACCLLAFDVQPPLPVLMVWLSVFSLLMIFPVSVAGWGLREATLAGVLAGMNLAAGVGVLASLCFGAVTLLALLPGLPWLLLEKSSHPAKEADEYPSRYHALD